MPQLEALTKKFKKSGKLVVVASHVTSVDDKVLAKFCKNKKYSFSVIKYFHLKGDQIKNKRFSLPFTVLIDTKGNVVEEGYKIKDLEDKIKKLIK